VRLAPIQLPLDLVFLLRCRPRPRHRCFFPLGPFWCAPGFPLVVASPFLILSLVIESGSRTLSVPDSLPGRGVRAVAWNFLAEPECAGQVDSRSLFCFVFQVLMHVLLQSFARIRTSFVFLCRQDLVLLVLTHCYHRD
jgi:hypothetical protein